MILMMIYSLCQRRKTLRQDHPFSQTMMIQQEQYLLLLYCSPIQPDYDDSAGAISLPPSALQGARQRHPFSKTMMIQQEQYLLLWKTVLQGDMSTAIHQFAVTPILFPSFLLSFQGHFMQSFHNLPFSISHLFTGFVNLKRWNMWKDMKWSTGMRLRNWVP